MRNASIIGGLVGLATLAAATAGQAAPQPPMNRFLSAYYRCDDNAAFNMAYDERRPQSAQMTVSPDSTHYDLKRTPSTDGFAFTDGAVKFFTDGKAVVTVDGAAVPLLNCKLQN